MSDASQITNEIQAESKPLHGSAFFKMACVLSAPIMLQNLISALVSSADTIMLGYVSQDAMAASSLANQFLSVLMMAFYGLMAGTSVLTAQYWGKKDPDTIERVLGLATRYTVMTAFLFFALALFFPSLVMHCFTSDEAIITEGIRYLRVVSFSYLFMGFSQIFVCAMRSMEKVVLPTLTYVVSLVVNIFINAVFIFGLFGLPKLGLVGVALGTVIARFTEMIICLVYMHWFSKIKIRIKYLFLRGGVLGRDFFNVTLPSVVNDLAWSLASSSFSVILGHMGSDVVAANAVAVMALNIGAIVSRGFANATTIIVSKPLGAGQIETGKLYAGRMLKLSTLFGVIGGLVMLLIRPWVLNMYADKLTEAALSMLGGMLALRGAQAIGEAFNTCLICGCFRAGGDARYGMIADSLCMWCMAVPIALLAAYVFKLPTMWIYAFICFDEFEKMIPFYLHYRKFKWLRNLTRDENELSAE